MILSNYASITVGHGGNLTLACQYGINNEDNTIVSMVNYGNFYGAPTSVTEVSVPFQNYGMYPPPQVFYLVLILILFLPSAVCRKLLCSERAGVDWAQQYLARDADCGVLVSSTQHHWRRPPVLCRLEYSGHRYAASSKRCFRNTARFHLNQVRLDSRKREREGRKGGEEEGEIKMTNVAIIIVISYFVLTLGGAAVLVDSSPTASIKFPSFVMLGGSLDGTPGSSFAITTFMWAGGFVSVDTLFVDRLQVLLLFPLIVAYGLLTFP